MEILAGIPGTGLETVKFWYLHIPVAAAREKLVATAVTCVMPNPVSLIESAGKGTDLGKGEMWEAR